MSFLENEVVRDLLVLAFTTAIGIIAYFIVKKYVLSALLKLFIRTKTDWDQILYEKGVFKSISLLVPALIVAQVLPFLTVSQEFVILVLRMWSLSVIVMAVDRTLNGVVAIYNTYPISHRMPITGYVQIVKIALFVFAAIIGISILIGQSPWAILGGLGALSAVLLLVFQDTILSFAAGIQLTMNDHIRVGDWIEMPDYNADGDVIEVALHTIKVQNWDKSISTIPTHKLVGNSVKNWRGMLESGGRRIKRSVFIDQTSIRFCDEEMVERFEKIQLLQEYLQHKKDEIAEYNRINNIDPASSVNGRHLTNIGTFRAYLIAYLRSNPKVNQTMTVMVRQLQPTVNGLPMEVYVFSNDPAWVNYEGIQADIFDHILAIIPEFDLRVFQNPGGHDLQRIASAGFDGAVMH